MKLLEKNELPQKFVYPSEFFKIVDQGLIDFASENWEKRREYETFLGCELSYFFSTPNHLNKSFFRMFMMVDGTFEDIVNLVPETQGEEKSLI
jgi:hypothetical protein